MVSWMIDMMEMWLRGTCQVEYVPHIAPRIKTIVIRTWTIALSIHSLLHILTRRGSTPSRLVEPHAWTHMICTSSLYQRALTERDPSLMHHFLRSTPDAESA